MVRWIVPCLVLVFVAAPGVFASDFRVFIPDVWRDAGLDRHLFPRFAFKSQMRLIATENEATAAFGFQLAPPGDDGVQIANLDELPVSLIPSDPDARDAMMQFSGWLSSGPGRSALLDFRIDGEPIFSVPTKPIEEAPALVLTGDPARGKALSEMHCARCHVVDRAKPFGAIGNSPSFHAMKSFEDWLPTFSNFYNANPHRALIAIESIRDPHTDQRPVHIARIQLSLDDVVDILAFVGTLEALDLGAPVQAR